MPWPQRPHVSLRQVVGMLIKFDGLDAPCAPGLPYRVRVLLAFVAGIASVLAFAPFELYPIGLLSLAMLVYLSLPETRLRAGFGLGFAWGLGAFIAGISWLYIALNRYGDVPAPVAALAILLFCAYLALFPALAMALFVRIKPRSVVLTALAFAGAWCGAEMLRGYLLTGFPWLAIGYSQTPPSPLAGFFPIIGVYGVGFILAWVAAMLCLCIQRGRTALFAGLMVLIFTCVGGAALGRIQWTAPMGASVSVALLQPNIGQALKWAPDKLAEVVEINIDMVRAHSADLVVLPETTLPVLADRLPPDFLVNLAEPVRANGGDLLLGVFTRDLAGRIFNSAISLGESPEQIYSKQHLVPFGEYMPPLFDWFYRLANIPMSNQTRGEPNQPPLRLAGQRVAINICYEDLFGHALIGGLPEATLFLNLSNLAWYGESFAQPQHLQIARVRAMETGRPMLRATNTGMTALVQPDGSVAGVLPQFERGALVMSVRGYQGMTPYGVWGDVIALGMTLLALGWVALTSRRSGKNG